MMIHAEAVAVMYSYVTITGLFCGINTPVVSWITHEIEPHEPKTVIFGHVCRMETG
jgi:hypothetical protein